MAHNVAQCTQHLVCNYEREQSPVKSTYRTLKIPVMCSKCIEESVEALLTYNMRLGEVTRGIGVCIKPY